MQSLYLDRPVVRLPSPSLEVMVLPSLGEDNDGNASNVNYKREKTGNLGYSFEPDTPNLQDTCREVIQALQIRLTSSVPTPILVVRKDWS